ncbi:MAG TPA: hypothetical protein VK729_08110 [Silvibacterium sp.]|nr:hypothetical protein [Silvibacterium sp.]
MQSGCCGADPNGQGFSSRWLWLFPSHLPWGIDNSSSPFFTVTPSNLPSGDTWPFNQNIFTILNVAVGGTLGGSISDLSNPGPMVVDYVRWYTPQ